MREARRGPVDRWFGPLLAALLAGCGAPVLPQAAVPLGPTDAPAVPAPARLSIGWGSADPSLSLSWAPPAASAAEAIAAFEASGRPFGWSDGAGGLLLSQLPLDVELAADTAPTLRLRTEPPVWIGPPTATPPEGALVVWIADGSSPPLLGPGPAPSGAAEGWSALPGGPPERWLRVGRGLALVQARGDAAVQRIELQREGG